ncbi:cytochrome c-type biogenesis protein CcsB [Seinonella peptonophila]|uniref:Cytochrome c-type biogenesis protein CcsB n=1 Tax=Seinonella peptonophila TaxID=112248 RepID=A0A1M4TIG3_9BACL|nr:c-type cytochrome biogenesis protein CcsB [Seinonella peptonophila]SHE44195.1 cytochrome c-type biogenesis protein CcsB [Seinonella peptonophila]
MEKIMESFLLGTFLLYLFSSISFMMGLTGKNTDAEVANKKANRWGKIAIWLAIIGVVFQAVFIIMRVIISGHFPTSNMFEFVAFLCFASVLAYIVIYFMYRTLILGAFVMPIAVILLGYASAFPKDIQPLIPALQSYWLGIHVTLAALGQGLFTVAFVAGLIYLLHRVGGEEKGRQPFYLEMVLVILLMFVGFSMVSFIAQAVGYQTTFTHMIDGNQVEQVYKLPPLIGPYKGQVSNSSSGWKEPLFNVPSWIEGEKAASKLNTTIWAIFSGLLLYLIIRLIIRKRLSLLLHRVVKNLNHELLDELSYRAIAIGFPIFTLGALIFAMIWAHEAWGRFWNWDPKETWALITWLFYSAYLHLRLSKGWLGIRSAWLAVGGFVVIMINLIVINFVIAGLHSYA